MSLKLINVVLDLETLSLQEDAAIIQIGCCVPKFDHIHLGPIEPEFEATVRYEDVLNSSFHKDKETMKWWEAQDSNTRKIVFSGQDSYTDVFDKFCVWIRSIKDITGGEVAVWGNGSDFDNRLLSYSLSSFGYTQPWSFRNNRDLRTLKAIFPVELIGAQPLGEVKHTALGDARYEARLINVITQHYMYAEEMLCTF